MSDLYIELLVKKKKTSTDTLLKVLMIGATVIFVLGGILFNPIILLLAVVMGVVDYFKLPSLDLDRGTIREQQHARIPLLSMLRM